MAIELNGNGYGNIPNTSSLQLGNTMTIEVIMMPRSLNGRFGLFSTRVNNTTGCFQLEIGSGLGWSANKNNSIAVTGIGNWVAETDSDVLEINKKYHIAYTRNGSGLTNSIYINGNALSLSQSDYTFINNSDDKRIGQGTSNTQGLKGVIYEVRIWNICRTQAQIQANLNTPLIGNESGLVAYYRFDENSGTTSKDLVSNNNISLVNASWMGKTLARAKNGHLLVRGKSNKDLPTNIDGLIYNYNFKENSMEHKLKGFRYIRDWLCGSNANQGNHWVEIQAYDMTTGTNIAQGKTVTASSGGTNLHLITDGSSDSGGYAYTTENGQVQWVQVDLGSVCSIGKLCIWHYWADGRTYYNTKTEISLDGYQWYPVFDSVYEGVYPETSTGHIINLHTLDAYYTKSRNFEENLPKVPLMQSPKTFRNGQYSQGDYINIGTLNFDFSKGFHFKFRARWDSMEYWSRVLDFANGPGSDNILVANIDTTRNLRFEVWNGGSSGPSLTATIPDGIHDYIVSCSNLGEGRIYIDGALVTSGAMLVPNSIPRTNCYIGKSNWGDKDFNGYIEYLDFYEGPYEEPAVLIDEITMYFGGQYGVPYGRDQYTRIGHVTVLGNDGIDYGLNSSGATWTASSEYPGSPATNIGLPDGQMLHYNTTGEKWLTWRSATPRIISSFIVGTAADNGGTFSIDDFPAHVRLVCKCKGNIVAIKEHTFAKPTAINQKQRPIDLTWKSRSNTSYVRDGGMWFESDTNNLASGRSLIIYNGYGTITSSLNQLTNETFYMGQPIYRLAMSTTDTGAINSLKGSPWSHGVYHTAPTFSANQPYFYSIYWRAVTHNDTVVSGVASNQGGNSWAPKDLITLDCGNGWKRSIAYFDGTNTANFSDSIYWSFYAPSYQSGQSIQIDWTCHQLEAKKYATRYWPTTLPASPGIPILANLGYSDFTITFDAMIDHIYSYPSNMNVGECKGLVGLYNKDFTRCVNVGYGWGNDLTILGESNAIQTSQGIYYEAMRKERYIIQRYNSNTLRVIKYEQNGNKLGEVSWTDNAINISVDIINIGYLLMGGWTSAVLHGNISNFSIYKRKLSDAEIVNLYKKQWSVKNNGNFIATKFVEHDQTLGAKSIYHWPLTSASGFMDTNKVVSPIIANARLDNDGMLVESNWNINKMTNWDNASSAAALNGANTSGSIQPVLESFQSKNRIKLVTLNNAGYSDNHIQFGSWSMNGLSPGVTYTFTALVYVPSGQNINLGNVHLSIWDYVDPGWVTTFSNVPTAYDTWQELTVSKTIRPGAQMIMFRLWVNELPPVKYIYCDYPRIEQRDKHCPFVRLNTNGSCVFNLNKDIGLDWSKDWTIAYWKFPMMTQDYGNSGYSIESLGSNGNWMNRGYIWYGKDANQNAIAYADSPNAIDPSTYFYNWRFITLLYNSANGTLTITEKSAAGVWTRSIALWTSNPKFFVSTVYSTHPEGYDFQLGGYDYNSTCPSYFRNLIVAKRLLTQSELDTIYSAGAYHGTSVVPIETGRKMKIKDGTVYLSGKLIENRSL